MYVYNLYIHVYNCVYYTKLYLYYTHTLHKHMSTDHRHWTSWLWSTYTFFICILHARLLHEIRQLIIGTEHPGSGPHTHSSYIHSSYIYFMHALFITILLELQLIIGTEQPMHMAQVPGPKSHTRIAQRARAGTEGSSCSRCECICRACLFFGRV